MLAGYASDQREEFKSIIEEEDDIPLKKKSEEEFKLIEQEIKAFDGLEDTKEEHVQAEVVHIDALENSIPNTLIQSYFPNNEKQRLAQPNSYTPDAEIQANQGGVSGGEIGEKDVQNPRISILAQTYQVKNKA